LFKSYLKIVLRNIARYKIYPIINILGLVLGLTSFILIGLYLIDELSYDKFFKNSDRIYRILDFYEKDGVGEQAATAPFPLAKAFEKEYPDYVEKTVRFFNFQVPHIFLQYKNKSFYEERFFFTDSTVFEIFDYKFIKGNPLTALDSSNSVVITKSIADKYFENENPLGKQIIYEEGISLTVTAVIEDVPSQTHLKFDFLASMSTLKNIINAEPTNWIWNPCWTYILLKNNTLPQNLEANFPDFVKKYFQNEYSTKLSIHLQKLTDIHLSSFLDYEIENNSNIGYVYILASMSIFILIISVINFTNLVTASSLTRAKEIAIKKTLGAKKIHLVIQLIIEAIVFTIIALIIAMSLAEILLPVFNKYLEKNIDFNVIFEFKYLSVLVLICLVCGFFSGIYPAVILASIVPSKVLKLTTSKEIGGKLSRRILVITQFTISIVLIICTIVSLRQFLFFGSADLGFNKDNVIIIPVSNTPVVRNYENFKKELLQTSYIENVTGMTDKLGVSHNTIEFTSDGFKKNINQALPGTFVGYDFSETFEIKILAGRDFSRIIPDDNIKSVLINESLAKYLGCYNYEDAIGKQFSTLQNNEKIIGVFKDFNINSLHHKITPFVVQMPKNLRQFDLFINYLAIRVTNRKSTEAINDIQNLWKTFSPVRPFEYTFLDKELVNQYKYEYVLVTISLILSIIAVIIASLGVLGLSSFITEQRTKEIGIRKILGANPLEIIKIVLLDFIKMILFSIILAFPISYFILNQWLKNFAYPIELKLWMFLAGAFITIIFTLLIVPYLSIKAAYKNPIDALRYE